MISEHGHNLRFHGCLNCNVAELISEHYINYNNKVHNVHYIIILT